jgi:hypothetical protein
MVALKDVVPWGRPLHEYISMFGLSAEDLACRILDCGGGPSSFTAEATAQGCRVVACDPLYTYSAEEIRQRIDETFPVIVAGMEAERDRFNWEWAGSPSQHAERRMRAMETFLTDYSEGLDAGRYIAEALPVLSFPDDSIDLALSSHFLFLYSDQLSYEFHVESIREMLRVARQGRVFPLLNLRGEPSQHLEPLMAELRRGGSETRIVAVDYEFQKGGNEFLLIDR